jgi:hypothetical protein
MARIASPSKPRIRTIRVHHRSRPHYELSCVIERPLRVSRPLPDQSIPATDAELSSLEALLAKLDDVLWKAEIHPMTGQRCVIAADDLAEFMPAEIVESFGQENPAIPEFVAQARNILPRLLAEVRRRRGY